MARNGNIHPTRIFRKPEELQKVWEAYKAELKERAKEWPKVSYVGRDGNRVVDYPVLPYTYDGLCRYCREQKIGEIHHYFDNQKGYYEDFREICHAIKQEIREHQITGGMINQFNPSITQRLNNLVERKEVEHKEQPLFGDDDEEDEE